MNRLRLRAEGGFTLIELLVVIAIIGILAAIAIPQFAAYRRRAFEGDALANARNLATAQEGYFVTASRYTTTVALLTGFNQSALVNITTSLDGSDFTITSVHDTCTGTTGVYTYNSGVGQFNLVSSCD